MVAQAIIHKDVKIVPEEVASDVPPKKACDQEAIPPVSAKAPQTSFAFARLATPSWDENSRGRHTNHAQDAATNPISKETKNALDICSNYKSFEKR
jgi:hypothetical protein